MQNICCFTSNSSQKNLGNLQIVSYFSLEDTEENQQTDQSPKVKMPVKASKRKARRDSPVSSVEEPEAARLRTENAPSISHRNFSEISEKS